MICCKIFVTIVTMKTPSTSSSVSLIFVPIKGNEPPEEILALNADSLGGWKICIVCITSFLFYFTVLICFYQKFLFCIIFDYNCAAENSSQCFCSNESRCRKFEFFSKRVSTKKIVLKKFK